MTTKEQTQAAARLMDKMSLATYEQIIATLKGAGVVSEANHLLTWTGPR